MNSNSANLPSYRSTKEAIESWLLGLLNTQESNISIELNDDNRGHLTTLVAALQELDAGGVMLPLSDLMVSVSEDFQDAYFLKMFKLLDTWIRAERQSRSEEPPLSRVPVDDYFKTRMVWCDPYNVKSRVPLESVPEDLLVVEALTQAEADPVIVVSGDSGKGKTESVLRIGPTSLKASLLRLCRFTKTT